MIYTKFLVYIQLLAGVQLIAVLVFVRFPDRKKKKVNKHQNQNQLSDHHSSYVTKKFSSFILHIVLWYLLCARHCSLTLRMEWWTR